MACGYCHNPELVKGTLKKLPFEQVTGFLESRAGMLDGTVLSGGECTLSPALPAFIEYLKDIGFKVKIDTNGTNPVMLGNLLDKNRIDYVALDYKAPTDKYASITGHHDSGLFRKSLKLLCQSSVPFEIRTTVHTDLLIEKDINIMIDDLEENGFTGTYYIQNFRDGKTLGKFPKQQYVINRSLIAHPRNFKIAYRNF